MLAIDSHTPPKAARKRRSPLPAYRVEGMGAAAGMPIRLISRSITSASGKSALPGRTVMW